MIVGAETARARAADPDAERDHRCNDRDAPRHRQAEQRPRGQEREQAAGSARRIWRQTGAEAEGQEVNRIAEHSEAESNRAALRNGDTLAQRERTGRRRVGK